jgi:hypothetical protein
MRQGRRNRCNNEQHREGQRTSLNTSREERDGKRPQEVELLFERE